MDIFGWSVIGLAILAPTFLLLFRDSIVIDFNNLGPIGDFLVEQLLAY